MRISLNDARSPFTALPLNFLTLRTGSIYDITNKGFPNYFESPVLVMYSALAALAVDCIRILLIAYAV